MSPVVRTAGGATRGCSSGCFVGLGMGFPLWCGSYSLQQTRVSIWYLLLPSLLSELLFCKLPFPKSLPVAQAAAIPSDGVEHTGRAGPAGDARDGTWERYNMRETECEKGGEVCVGGSSLSLEESKTIPMASFLLPGYIPWCLSTGVLVPRSDCFTLRSEINLALTSCVLLQCFSCCSTAWCWGYQHHTRTPSSHVDLFVHLPEGIWRSSSLGCSRTPVPAPQEKPQRRSP